KAYALLKQLQQLIKSQQTDEDQLMNLSSEFYILIPCVSRTRTSRLPVINTNELINKFAETLDELSNLQIANTILEQTKINIHPLDAIYQEIMTTITPLDKKHQMYSIIENYIKNT